MSLKAFKSVLKISIKNSTKTLVDSSNLVLSSSSFSLPSLHLRPLLWLPLCSAAHGALSAHSRPHRYFARAGLSTGSASLSLNFLLLKIALVPTDTRLLLANSDAPLPPSLLWSFCLFLGTHCLYFWPLTTIANSPSPLWGIVTEISIRRGEVRRRMGGGPS